MSHEYNESDQHRFDTIAREAYEKTQAAQPCIPCRHYPAQVIPNARILPWYAHLIEHQMVQMARFIEAYTPCHCAVGDGKGRGRRAWDIGGTDGAEPKHAETCPRSIMAGVLTGRKM